MTRTSLRFGAIGVAVGMAAGVAAPARGGPPVAEAKPAYALDGAAGRLAVSPDGKRLCCCDGWKVVLFDLDARKPIPLPKELKERVWEATFCPDGRLLVAWDRPSFLPDYAGGRAGLLVYDFKAGRATPLGTYPEAVSCLGVSADGRWAVVGGHGKAATVFDVHSGKKVRTLEYERDVTDVSFDPAAGLLAVGLRDGNIQVISTEDWKVRNETQVPPLLHACRFVAAGRLAVWWSNGARGEAGFILRDALRGTGRPDDRLPGGTTFARAPAGPLLAIGTAGEDDGWNIQLWDLTAGKPRARFRAHPGGTDSVTFSADGRWLFTGGRDQRVNVWNVGRLVGPAE